MAAVEAFYRIDRVRGLPQYLAVRKELAPKRIAVLVLRIRSIVRN